MKRLFCIFLCILLMATAISASAEEFVLRNGITFNDDLPTVKSKETLNLASEKEAQLYYRGTISGIEGRAIFSFDEESGNLTDLFYGFGTNDNENVQVIAGYGYASSNEVDENYEILYDGLVRKYGKPLGNTDGSVNLITGKAFDDYIDHLDSYSDIDDDYECTYRDYAEWLIKTGDSYVKIDLVSYSMYVLDFSVHRLSLSYHYCPEEEYTAAIQGVLDKQNVVDNDL